MGDPVRVAARLAPVLDAPERELHAQLTSGKGFVWLRRKLPPAMAARVRGLGEPGLGFLGEPLRLYPNRELAAHVLGFEGVDGGLEGIERALNDALAGTSGRAIVGRDALGREVAMQQTLTPPAPGHGVMLTLDRTIQYLAEREIDAAYRRTQARGAMAVALDPRNGDVLALALRPTFNPNAFLDVPSREVWRNRAITDPFEPGSTFKVILAAAALEEGVVRPDDRIWAENGQLTIAKTTIHDWRKFGWLSFGEVLQNSSNVGSMKVGLALGPERFHRYMTRFGFGAPTGVGLPGESRGLLRDPQRWSPLSLPTMSIGQEVSVTALQMLAAFGAVANGGTLMQPRLVKAEFDADGRELRRLEPRAVRQVVSPETARTLARMLVQVVDAARAARPSRRAEDREVGQRGGGTDLRRDRRPRAALPGRPAARRHADPDRDRPGRRRARRARATRVDGRRPRRRRPHARRAWMHAAASSGDAGAARPARGARGPRPRRAAVAGAGRARGPRRSRPPHAAAGPRACR